MTEKGEQGAYSRRQPIPHRSDTCPPRTCRGLNSSWGMWAARSRAPRSPGSTGIPRRCTTHDQSSSQGTNAVCSRCQSSQRCTRTARNRNRRHSASSARRRSGTYRGAVKTGTRAEGGGSCERHGAAGGGEVAGCAHTSPPQCFAAHSRLPAVELSGTEQSSPLKPRSHTQCTPFKWLTSQLPRPEHAIGSPGQVDTSHARPRHPASQRHSPSTQRPFGDEHA